MAAARTCQKCGSRLPIRSPEGLCPRCLMQRAMAGDTPVQAGAMPPSATSTIRAPATRPGRAQADLEATEGTLRPFVDDAPRPSADATGDWTPDPTDPDATTDGRGAARGLPRGTTIRYFGDYELPDGARPRRHGRRLPGPPGQPQPPRRPQDDPGRRPGRRRRAAPVPERGRGGRPARPPRHRAGLRGRRARRPALLQHEAGRRRQPRRAAGRLHGRPAGRGRGWWPRRPRRCTTPTSGASSTAT